MTCALRPLCTAYSSPGHWITAAPVHVGISAGQGCSFYFYGNEYACRWSHAGHRMITGRILWNGTRVAAVEPLPLETGRDRAAGHRFGARVYAEDPTTTFTRSPARPPNLPRAGGIPHNVRVRHRRAAKATKTRCTNDPDDRQAVVWDDRERALQRLAVALARVSDRRHGDQPDHSCNNLATSDTFQRAEP